MVRVHCFNIPMAANKTARMSTIAAIRPAQRNNDPIGPRRRPANHGRRPSRVQIPRWTGRTYEYSCEIVSGIVRGTIPMKRQISDNITLAQIGDRRRIGSAVIMNPNVQRDRPSGAPAKEGSSRRCGSACVLQSFGQAHQVECRLLLLRIIRDPNFAIVFGCNEESGIVECDK